MLFILSIKDKVTYKLNFQLYFINLIFCELIEMYNKLT